MLRETVLLKENLIGKYFVRSVAEQGFSVIKYPNVAKEHFKESVLFFPIITLN